MGHVWSLHVLNLALDFCLLILPTEMLIKTKVKVTKEIKTLQNSSDQFFEVIVQSTLNEIYEIGELVN